MWIILETYYLMEEEIYLFLYKVYDYINSKLWHEKSKWQLPFEKAVCKEAYFWSYNDTLFFYLDAGFRAFLIL